MNQPEINVLLTFQKQHSNLTLALRGAWVYVTEGGEEKATIALNGTSYGLTKTVFYDDLLSALCEAVK